MAAYTLYWKKETVDRYIDEKRTDLSAGLSGQFLARGVQRGDWIYPLQVREGRLGLICALRIAAITPNSDSPDPRDYWKEMAIAAEGTATPMRFDGFLSDEAVRRVEFESDSSRSLLISEGRVSWHCLRAMRKMTPDTQRLFDEHLRRIGSCS